MSNAIRDKCKKLHTGRNDKAVPAMICEMVYFLEDSPLLVTAKVWLRQLVSTDAWIKQPMKNNILRLEVRSIVQ